MPPHLASKGELEMTPCEAIYFSSATADRRPEPRAKVSRGARLDWVEVRGDLVPEYARWMLTLHQTRFDGCYELALLRHGELAGTYEARLRITRDGSVGQLSSSGDFSHRDAALTKCFDRALRAVAFTPPEGGEWQLRARLHVAPIRGTRIDPKVWLTQPD